MKGSILSITVAEGQNDISGQPVMMQAFYSSVVDDVTGKLNMSNFNFRNVTYAATRKIYR